MRLAEEKKIVPVAYSTDYNDGCTFDSINMKNFHRATFIIGFGVITGDAILYFYSGATDGAKSSALTFHYAFASAALGSADCDVLAADSTSAALTITGTSYDGFMLIAEVEAVDMDVANGENWLTGYLSDAASAGVVFAFAILEPRYTNNLSVSALV
jgi:hypothetical protein